MTRTIQDKAKQLLVNNTVRKEVQRNGLLKEITYTAPSPGTYDQQWFWDSCLHSLVWLKLGERERAFQEIQSLVIGKSDKKFFPHMIFWKTKKDIYWRLFDHLYPTILYSELIQPPLIGFSLNNLLKSGIKKARLEETINHTYSYYNYILKVRDPEEMGLISIIHPWESGLDSSPSFDLGLDKSKFLRLNQWKRMRYLLKEFQDLKWNQTALAKQSSFRVKCVLTNTLLAWGMDSFANVLEDMNRMEEAHEFRENVDRIWHSLIRYSWNEEDGLFYNLEIRNNEFKQITINTISSLLPILLDIPSEMKDSLLEHLIDPSEYWSKYPIPTVSMKERTFDPSNNSLLWRGPTWINTNFFIWLGLRKHKEMKLANELAKRSISLVEKSGFREFFNPITGKGGGAKEFGWSTLVTLMDITK